MAHLTASPFHKPSAFEVARAAQLPTPPDTDTDFAGLGQPHGAPAEGESWGLPSGPADGRHHRVSTLQYRNTGFRERDRTSTRQSKWLVVVLPPPSVAERHGHLGHTLSSGPASRLSQGVLMSLFPTMYGQLTAIAREFNFPSTTGLCVYLQISEGGLSMTPRISDETWQILWGHLFEPRSPAPPPLQQFPVCGRIEFDIDLSKARWFDPWVMSSRRPAMDVPISVPPSISHMRADSKTTFLDDQVGDAQSELSYTPMKPRAFTRHVPRKLSLVDRLDSVSVASGLATTVPRGEDGVDAQMRNALTPIVQEDEGKVGSRDLNTRVRSWRAGSSVAPTPLAAVGQISLDPVHMPNTIQLPDTLTVPDGAPEELNLDDFKWSASSLGPPEFYDVESRISSPRVPSVHIDGRLEGSVLLTPTTATSWGPPDDISSVSPTPNLWRLPSPDIAWRMLDDVPLTPSTATSWGPPSEYLDSVSSISRPPSVDIGARMVISRPNTPSTATSWGPPSSWPPTPFGYYELDAPRTPDIAERGQSSPHRYQASYLSFPRFREEAATWEHVWPFNSVASSVHTHVHPSSRAQVEGAWDLVWPFTQPHGLSADLDHHVSDVLDRVYFNTTDSLHAGARVTVALPASYPTFNLYPAIYPHFEIYPGNPCGLQLPQERIRPLYSGREHLLPSSYQPEYPDFNIYPPTRRMVSTEWKRKNLFEPVSLQLPSFYPCLRPYPLVYPHNLSEIYPQILSRQDGSRSAISSSNYQVSTGVASHQSRQADSLTVTLEASYPSFSLYPAVYPAFEIYPVLSTPQEQAASRTISLDVHVNYPLIVLYPSAYPNFDIYPMVPSKSGDCSSTETYHTVEYPFFTLYPAVYPFLDIYPAKTTIQQERHLDISFNPLYPHFDLYPAVYPNFDIYRTGHASNLDTYQKMQPVTIPAGYPAIHIYTPVYPHFEIWPEHRHLAVASSMRRRRRLHAELHEEVLRETPTSGSMDVTGKDTLGVSRRRRRTHAELHAEVIRHGTTLSQTETSTEADRREPSPSAHIPRGTTHLSTSPASRSPSTSPVEAGNPLPPRRARSGTISSRQSSSPTSPAELQSLKTPKSSSPSSPHVRESVSFAPLSSRISAPLRRVSSARPLSVAVPSHSTLSPVDEDPSRVASASTLQRSGSLASQRKSPSRRDSLVLERARLFETMSSHDDAPTRITMSALAQFPTPPVPPVPPLPTDARRLSHSPDLIPTFRR